MPILGFGQICVLSLKVIYQTPSDDFWEVPM